MIRKLILDTIRDMNDLDDATQPENPEYFRGQIDLALHLLGFEDDGYGEMQEILTGLGVHPDYFDPRVNRDLARMEATR